MRSSAKQGYTGAEVLLKTGVRVNCPNCYVTNVRWRVKLRSFICNRCGQEFTAAGNKLPTRRHKKA